MTSREYKYHKSNRIWRRIRVESVTIPFRNEPFNFGEPNFGMMMPLGISRNVDGTPKEVKPEYLNPVLWDDYTTALEREKFKMDRNILFR